MIVYYYEKGQTQYGSFNETKIIAMAGGRQVYSIHYSEFKGMLLSDEWNG